MDELRLSMSVDLRVFGLLRNASGVMRYVAAAAAAAAVGPEFAVEAVPGGAPDDTFVFTSS